MPAITVLHLLAVLHVGFKYARIIQETRLPSGAGLIIEC